MQDISQISGIGGKPPVQPPSLVAALQAFISGNSVPNIPPALQQSPPGQLISAFVLAVNPKGQVLLQTPQGQIAFTSNVPLTVGQQLILESLPRSPQPQQVPGAPPPPASAAPIDVKLVRVNGVPAESVFPQAAASATSTPESRAQSGIQAAANALTLRAVFPQRPLQQSRQEQSAPSLFDAEAVEYDASPVQSQSRFKATVVNTPTQAAPGQQSAEVESAARVLTPITDLPEQLTQLKTGDVLTLKIVGGTLAPQITSAATVIAPSVVNAGGATSDAEAPAPASSTSTTANAITQRAFPNMPLPAVSAPAAFSATVPGIVIGQEASGEAVVHTEIATLRLPSGIALPRGTQLSLNITELESVSDLFAASQLPRAFQTGNPATDALVKGATALDSLLKQIFGMNADAAHDIADTLLPKPGRELGNKIIQFIASVKEESLPKAIHQALPKEVADQLGLTRVSHEFSSMKQAMTEAPSQNWNFMLVPLMQGEEMSHMRWYKRKQKDEDDAEKEGTRFVVELETQSLGSIQLDGLFFNQPSAKQFDLVIRSNQEFALEEQQKILEIYNNYGEITGYQGSLRFEQTSQFPVQPLSDILSGKNHEISA